MTVVTGRQMPEAVWNEVLESVQDRLENLRDLAEATELTFEREIHYLELAEQELQQAYSVPWAEQRLLTVHVSNIVWDEEDREPEAGPLPKSYEMVIPFNKEQDETQGEFEERVTEYVLNKLSDHTGYLVRDMVWRPM